MLLGAISQQVSALCPTGINAAFGRSALVSKGFDRVLLSLGTLPRSCSTKLANSYMARVWHSADQSSHREHRGD